MRALLCSAAVIVISFLSLPEARAQTSPSSGPTRIDATAFVAMDPLHASRSLDERSFAFDAHGFRAAVGDGDHFVIVGFPIGTALTGAVELERRRGVIDARTRVRVATTEGEIAGALPSVAVYRGRVQGDERSRVFLVSAGKVLYGFVERSSGERFVIGPRSDGSRDGADHVVAAEFSVDDALRDFATQCRSEETHGYHASGKRPEQARAMWRGLLEVRVAVEADQEFLRRAGGSVETATGYIIALWSMVSAMYEDEIDVTFRLPWIKVWTIADPYQVAGNGYALWGKAPAYWQQNYGHVERDLAHIFTASDWGGGGIAFRGQGIDGGQPVICSRERGYAMSSPRGVLSYPTFAFTYDAYIVAHETGHNFGARHTHDCWWSPALDTCMTRDDQQFAMDDACQSSPVTPKPSAGSVMSYCMGVNQKAGGGSFEAWSVALYFTPRVAAVMRQEVELATCARAPEEPTIVLTSPRGRIARLSADTTIAVTWNAVGVDSYNVEYTADDGRIWSSIAAGLAADVLTHPWAVASIASDSVLVRVVDAADATVGDTSLLRFAVAGSSSVVDGDDRDVSMIALEVEGSGRSGCCEMRLALASSSHVSLAIFDNAGRRVATLLDGWVESGSRSVAWDHPSDASGIYWAVLRASGAVVVERLIIGR